MYLKIEEWEEVIGAVNSSNGNLLEQIKKMLEEQNKGAYQQWEQKNFDINHQFGTLFTKDDDTFDKKLSLLHIAAFTGNLDMVRALLEQGANVDEKEADGWTPLHLAAKYGYKQVVTTLLEKGANVDEKEDDGLVPLHLAAEKGHEDIVTTLLEKGANPLINDKDGKTPRELAKDKNIIQVLKKSETTQITSKAIKTGSICSAIAALAVGGGCFAVGIQLPILALIGIVVAAAVLTGFVAGGITYSALRPSDKLDKPDLEVANQQIPEKGC